MYLDLTSMEGKIVFHCYICYAFSFCAKAGALNKPLGAPALPTIAALQSAASIYVHIIPYSQTGTVHSKHFCGLQGA